MSSIKRKVDEILAKKDASIGGSRGPSKTSKTLIEVGSGIVPGKLKNDDDDDDDVNKKESNDETKGDDYHKTSSSDCEEEEDDDEEEEEEHIHNVKTCSRCSLFCASWTQHLARGSSRVTCEMTSHHGIYCDPYSSNGMAAPANTTNEIGMGSHGCTVDQRVALLCSLYELSKTTRGGREEEVDFRIFADPQFLHVNFKDLIHEPKVIKVAVLYGCNKLFPEALVLARNCGVAELEDKVGKLKVYQHPFLNDNDDNHNFNEHGNVRPYAVEEVEADGDEHFSLTWEQWKKLRTYVGSSSCAACGNNMSIFTFYNRASVDVESIMASLHIS